MRHSDIPSRRARRITLILIVGLLSGIIFPRVIPLEAPGEPPARLFTVATYNVKNLFDEHDDPYSSDEETTPPTKPREEVEALARVIRAMDADVLALQEVESIGVLRRFKNGFLKGMNYMDPVLIEGNDRRGIDVAVLSKLPVGRSTSYRHLVFPLDEGKSTRFSRDLLRVKIQPSRDNWIDLYVVHLRSGSDAGDRRKREAEARKVREIIDEELAKAAGYRFILLGDFNDGRESTTIRTIEGEGERRLFCPTDSLPSDEAFTFFRGGREKRFDYLFCSPSVESLYVRGSARVIAGEDAALASDHLPVIASFELPGGK